MGRCKNGETISPPGRSAAARKTLHWFLDEARGRTRRPFLIRQAYLEA